MMSYRETAFRDEISKLALSPELMRRAAGAALEKATRAEQAGKLMLTEKRLGQAVKFEQAAGKAKSGGKSSGSWAAKHWKGLTAGGLAVGGAGGLAYGMSGGQQQQPMYNYGRY